MYTTIPQEALYSIFEGKSLLFLGAGFSIGAKRINSYGKEELLPTGTELADKLMSEIGEERKPQDTLAKCAEFYQNSKNREALLKILAEILLVKTPTYFQKEILSYPWSRIYTTNYDNIVSVAGTLPKKLRLIGLKDNISHYTNSTIECLCINGYLANDPKESDIVITSYDYGSPHKEKREEIIRTFRVDISMVDSVFFLGYSIYDIEVAKILQNDTSICKKVYFIVGKNIRKIEKNELSKYGSVYDIDCEDFSSIIKNASISYQQMPKLLENIYTSLSEYLIPRESETKEPVYDLLVKSKFDRYAIKSSLLKNSSNILIRDKLSLITQSIKNSAKCIIVHSNMCNGKTIFLEELAADLSEFYHIFFAKPTSSKLNRDLIELSRNNEDKQLIVIIDGYARAFSEFSPIFTRLKNIIFILAERTSIHRQLENNISALNNPEIYSIDQLSDSEIFRLVKLLKDNGITGETEAYLSSKICNDYERSIGKTIIRILQNCVLTARISNEMKGFLDREKTFTDEIYCIVMLSIITGHAVERHILNWILDRNTAYSSEFNKSTLFYEILKGNEDDIYCSGTLAQILVKKVFDAEKALLMILRIAKFARKNMNNGDFCKQLSISSMRYHMLEKVLPDEDFLNNSIHFYAELKNVGGLGNFPLFWLHYAMAYINKKQYDIAYRYLLTAYDLARHIKFNVYQIDNQFARLLLSADDTIPPSPFERFEKAEVILLKQLNDGTPEYVFRSAGALIYFRKYFHIFSHQQLIRIIGFIKVFEQKYYKLSTEMENKTKWDMERIIEAKNTANQFLNLTEGINLSQL